ncbi:hypothetical protein EVAR_42011_1 [Eumeta japonica]|uniref:Uncharacterized protein n=1 Tax=Eumeta variegata TaxID=151549 RepID=A0A4C1WKZ2_EUMVA|nr:hypothetical protein EVAR_42011_1 [Eumeta japonica]
MTIRGRNTLRGLHGNSNERSTLALVDTLHRSTLPTPRRPTHRARHRSATGSSTERWRPRGRASDSPRAADAALELRPRRRRDAPVDEPPTGSIAGPGPSPQPPARDGSVWPVAAAPAPGPERPTQPGQARRRSGHATGGPGRRRSPRPGTAGARPGGGNPGPWMVYVWRNKNTIFRP